MTDPKNPPQRTIRQINDKDGNPAQATHTDPLWVGYNEVFSQPTESNKIIPFVTGEAYYSDFMASLDAAATEVFILGWQINWDALLKPGVRLYDVIYRNAKRGVNFYIMPWKHSNPVQTYDAQTKIVLESINGRLKKEKEKGGTVTVLLAASQADKNAGYFSHHQKQVIVDRKIAYIGGIDLAYGRFDDATYDLHSKANGRWFLNSYNPGLPYMRSLNASNIVDPDLITGAFDYVSGNGSAELKKIEAGGYQMRYADNLPVNIRAVEADTAVTTALSELQPRMPWQDVHSRIEGPAVSHLLRNFVMRWNILASSKLQLAMAAAPASFGKPGNASIQVLRTAPAEMRSAEYKALKSKQGIKAPSGPENDIHLAMIGLIHKAKRFIYIEGQFFVSNFGTVGGLEGSALSPAAQFIKDGPTGIGINSLFGMRKLDSDSAADLDKLPQNHICTALVARIQKAIDDVSDAPFHVYITLPVHPEGSLLMGAVAVQVFWTMQSLVHGSKSLLNGIRRALKVKELRAKKDPNPTRAYDDSNTEYEDIAYEKCFDYVTLLNLRNWVKFENGGYATEQVYVHTKLVIVDDLYALLGSANINDRSLLGGRDSEIAVLVQDNDTKRADINGKGSNQPVRLFAHNLRMDIWKKLFGMTGKVRPADDLKQAIEQPGIPDSWRLIQRRAEQNAALYEAAFPWVPRSWGNASKGKPVKDLFCRHGKEASLHRHCPTKMNSGALAATTAMPQPNLTKSKALLPPYPSCGLRLRIFGLSTQPL